jgi:hypothetical protein
MIDWPRAPRSVQVRKKDPQFDLLLGILNRVRTVADVATNSEGIVTTDSTCKFWFVIGVARIRKAITNRGQMPAGSLRQASNGPS